MIKALFLVFGLILSLPAKACDTALILLMDRSGSMTDEEFTLQISGTAEAFRSPEVIRRILGSGGGGSIQARVATFALGTDWHTPWTRIASQDDARAFSGVVANIPRISHGGTYTGDAVMTAVRSFETLPEACDRHVIDVSTDGVAADERTLAEARKRAEELEITINAVTVALADEENTIYAPQIPQAELTLWAQENLIIGIGSFVLPANFGNYAQAMRTKLTMELAGVQISTENMASPQPLR